MFRISMQKAAIMAMKIGKRFTRNGLKYEYLGMRRSMLKVRLVGDREIISLPFHEESDVQQTSGTRSGIEEESNRIRQVSKQALRINYRQQQKLAQAKLNEIEDKLRLDQTKLDDIARQESLEIALKARLDERLRLEADNLLRSHPALRQLAIDYYSRIDDE